MKKVKTYISMALIGAMALSFTGCNMIKRTAASIGKTVLAEVDGTKITRADVDAELKSTLSQYKEQYGDDFEENSDLKDKLKSTRENVVDSLVEKEVLLKMAKKLDLVPEEDEINKYAEEQVQKYRDQVASSSTATETSTATVEEEFNKFLDNYGYTLETFTQYFKDTYVINKVIEDMVKDVTVSDDEIQSYYDENTDSYKREAGADAYNILVDSEEKAKEIKSQIKSLDDFKKFADENNTDSTKGKGGYLGYVTYENSGMVEEFTNAFKELKSGEVSDPLMSDYGWHLIMAENVHTEAYTATVDEAKAEIESTLLNNKKQQAYNDKLDQYKEEVGVKEHKDRL